MLERLIRYFSHKHLLMNFVFLGVFIGGFFAWHHTSKEELPDITFDRMNISVAYPGASAEDVEYFVTKPIEDAVSGVDGVYSLYSTSSAGFSSVSVELDAHYGDKDEAFLELRNEVSDVRLPSDIYDDPSIRIFKTSKKAIIDVAIIDKSVHLLDIDSRHRLQEYALSLENQLLNLPAVNSVNRSGYLQEEIQIKANPQKLLEYEIPFNTVMQEIKNNNVRQPAGIIESLNEPKVTLSSELDSVDKLNDLAIQGGFEGRLVKLSEVADVKSTYEKNISIIKINGHEGILLRVVKNSSYGILDAIDAVNKGVYEFKKNNLNGNEIDVFTLDDESIDIRNRLSLIGINGLIGFVMIVAILFIFLNKRSGLWVAMGIPFTFCFTMICASMLGYSINNITLASVIIVMGMIVDDAIVVAENITRHFHNGEELSIAVVKGCNEVVKPIIACIITTCAAFVPLFFFGGHGGKFIINIPPIIFLMLGASLLEAVFVLPGHMNLELPRLLRRVFHIPAKEKESGYGHWFDRVEDKYSQILQFILKHKLYVLIAFLILFIVSGLIVKTKMKYVMFPNEETRDLVLSGSISKASKRLDTAEKTKEIENIIAQYLGKEVVGFRTAIARSRRGSAVEEFRFRTLIEILPKKKRKKSADQLIKEFKEKFDKLNGFEKLIFQKSRWGHGSPTPIEVMIQNNNDKERDKVTQLLAKAMEDYKELDSIEVEEGIKVTEYMIRIDQQKAKRLSINPKNIAETFRAALQGLVLYDFSDSDEDIDVRFTVNDETKTSLDKILDLTVENKGDYLVPLRDVVIVDEVTSANSIVREAKKRLTRIDAGIVKGSKLSPLDIAVYLEDNVFPDIIKESPGTLISFGGEVKNTRESKGELRNSVFLVLFLIFIILAVLFNSLTKPLIIMLAIPFGLIGVILAFWLHGKLLFGFYAAIGALGLAGVVVNDSIIMLTKLERECDFSKNLIDFNKQVAEVAKTRLRAVFLTTITTVAGVLPTAYGWAGYDAMLAEMMLALAWGLMFATLITLILIPCIYSLEFQARKLIR